MLSGNVDVASVSRAVRCSGAVRAALGAVRASAIRLEAAAADLGAARASVDRRAGALATALDACEVLAVSTGASAGGRRHTREATLAHEVRVLEAEVVGLGGSAAIGGGNRPVTIAAAARLEAVGGATVVAVVAGAGRPAAGAALEAHVDLRSAPGGAPTRLILALDFYAPTAYQLRAAYVAHGAINVADVTTRVDIQ